MKRSMIGTAVDRLVGWVNPEAGLRRLRSRTLLTRAYEGASTLDGWRPRRPGASANTDHAADARTLRIRTRSLYQNVPYIAQGARAHTANIVGTGIVPRWIGPRQKQRAALWLKFGQEADADGRLDVNGLIDLAHGTAQRDGEVLIRIRWRRPTDGLAVPVQLQVLEIDWLDDSRTGVIDGRTVVNGIAYDTLGKVAGYYLHDQHPGDMQVGLRRSTFSRFIPASLIIHYFQPERPGQGRGITRVAPVIARARDLMLYEDAERQRKNLETRLAVLFGGDAEGPGIGEDNDEATGPGNFDNVGQLPSGAAVRVPTGSHITVVEPKAAPGYVDYLKMELHLIAAGAGWTYEMMTGDVRDVNFSSARIRRLDYRREAEREQWLHLIPGLVARIVGVFEQAAELGGRGAEMGRPDQHEVRYATPKWEHVNPQQDVNAELAEVAGGLSTLSEKLRRRGEDPDEVFDEMASDFKRLREMGILDVLMMFQKGKPMDGDTPEQASGTPAK